MSDKKRDYAEVLRVARGEFLGIQRGPRGALVLFTDPESWTTLAVHELEFCPKPFLSASKRVAGRSSFPSKLKSHSVEVPSPEVSIDRLTSLDYSRFC